MDVKRGGLIVKSIHVQIYNVHGTEFILGSFESELCLLDYYNNPKRMTVDQRLQRLLKAEYIQQESDVLKEARKQLDDYFSGLRRRFEMPIKMVGSEFQLLVWRALEHIPFGATTSYSELAQMIHRPSSVRAVANANAVNALAIIIPCHRVIGRNGAMVGYSGGVEMKTKLLDLEGVTDC